MKTIEYVTSLFVISSIYLCINNTGLCHISSIFREAFVTQTNILVSRANTQYSVIVTVAGCNIKSDFLFTNEL